MKASLESHGRSRLHAGTYDFTWVTAEGGSTPAHLRNAFIDLIEDETPGDAACRLAAQLANCTDVLPIEYCEILGLETGSTFAQAARKVRTTLGCVGPS